ncbi:hypothetical protein EDD86DRAFT_219483 [Gorgonomyces haynaldii]|nr:hypothetical protein EDD86DRAFT_219483 [Gorgonomyces haynaldii]
MDSHKGRLMTPPENVPQPNVQLTYQDIAYSPQLSILSPASSYCSPEMQAPLPPQVMRTKKNRPRAKSSPAAPSREVFEKRQPTKPKHTSGRLKDVPMDQMFVFKNVFTPTTRPSSRSTKIKRPVTPGHPYGNPKEITRPKSVNEKPFAVDPLMQLLETRPQSVDLMGYPTDPLPFQANNMLLNQEIFKYQMDELLNLQMQDVNLAQPVAVKPVTENTLIESHFDEPLLFQPLQDTQYEDKLLLEQGLSEFPLL